MDSNVSELIYSASCTWKKGLIHSVFPTYVEDQIVQIPLILRSNDKLVWDKNRRGVYTMNSGYHSAMNLLDKEGNIESSGAQNNLELWTRLWNLKLQNKVKNFAWRACTNSLPTKLNLMRRHILPNAICDQCKQDVESCNHVFWWCLSTQKVWETRCPLGFQSLHAEMEFQDLLWTVMEVNVPIVPFVLTISWGIWKYNNLSIFEHSDYVLQEIVDNCLGYVESFITIRPNQSIVNKERFLSWKPKPLGKVKFNFDGALF
ncbi:hypothetical protein I3760_09G140200 [Carya illinoinensis]|nr:hypothetical protein I3760_09G140200 [Carya illinoinensis]